LRCLVGLTCVAIAPGQTEIGLADPVLGIVGELVIGEAAQELSEPGDGEGVAPLAEVDVRRLIDVLRLKRPGGRT
jgi:hypothetical protein